MWCLQPTSNNCFLESSCLITKQGHFAFLWFFPNSTKNTKAVNPSSEALSLYLCSEVYFNFAPCYFHMFLVVQKLVIKNQFQIKGNRKLLWHLKQSQQYLPSAFIYTTGSCKRSTQFEIPIPLQPQTISHHLDVVHTPGEGNIEHS